MNIKFCKDILTRTAENLLDLSDRLSDEPGMDLTEHDKELIKIGTLPYISDCLMEAKHFYVSGMNDELKHSFDNILMLSDITANRNPIKPDDDINVKH